MNYAVGEFVYMLPSDMNLQIGNVRNYNNKILISSPSFKIGTNVKVNIDVKSKEVDNRRLMVKTEPDVIELEKRRLNVKSKVITKPNVEPNKEHKQDIKPNTGSKREHKQDTKPDIEFKRDVKKPDMITYEEEKVALVLGITSILTVWWMLK